MHPEIHAITHKFLARLMQNHDTSPEDVEWLHKKILSLLHEKTRTAEDLEEEPATPKGRGRRNRVDRNQVLDLLDQGFGTGQVATMVGCSPWTVSQIKKGVSPTPSEAKPKGNAPLIPKDITPLVDAVRAAGPQGITSKGLLERDIPGFTGMDAREMGKLLGKIPELSKSAQPDGPALWKVRNANLFDSAT